MALQSFDVAGSVRLRDVARPAAGETKEQRAHRLAQKAVISGVRILTEPRSGFTYATSASDASILYRLDLVYRTCTCRGFERHGVCQHLALALVQAGEIPLEPAPEPVICPECHGRRGEKMSTGGHLSDWVWRTCSTCQGAGVVTGGAR
jgi:hypothetical protein